MFAPNALPQLLQNLTLKLTVDGLTRRYEFLVDSSLDVEKTINMVLTFLRTWHKFRRNAFHVKIVLQNASNGPVWQSYYPTNIVDSSPTICNDSLANFCYVFRCCAVDGRPERLSSSTDVHPSLKRLYHKKVLLWLMALFPKTSCIIRWVSAAVFQHWNKIWCRFLLRHISCKKSPDH